MGTTHSQAVGDELHIARSQVGVSDPNGVITAGIIGQFHWDSVGEKLYIAEAADDVSWVHAGARFDTWVELIDTPASIPPGVVIQGNAAGTALEGGQALRITDAPTFDSLTLSTLVVTGNIIGDLKVQDQMTVGGVTAPATSASIDLTATDKALLYNRLTTAQRNAITPVAGMSIFHIEGADIEFYDGVAWVSMGGGDVVGPVVSVAGGLAVYLDTGGNNIISPAGVTYDGVNMDFGNSKFLRFGGGNDFTLHHDGSSSQIVSSGGGGMFLRDTSSAGITLSATNSTAEVSIKLGTNTTSTSFAVENASPGTDLFNVFGNGQVTIGPNIFPGTTALLEMVSTTHGFLPPRMTLTQRDAIVNPATGLQIHNTTNFQPESYNGEDWTGIGIQGLLQVLASGNNTNGIDIIFDNPSRIITPDGGQDLFIVPGDGVESRGGDFVANAGDAQSATLDFAGGSTHMHAGKGINAGSGGDAHVTAGSGGDSGNGGLTALMSGDGGLTAGFGGFVVIMSGDSFGASQNAGIVQISAGNAAGLAGVGGDITLKAGNASDVSPGNISILAGTATFDGSIGNIVLQDIADGKVGIGINAPSTLLHIAGLNTDLVELLTLENTDASNSWIFQHGGSLPVTHGEANDLHIKNSFRAQPTITLGDSGQFGVEVAQNATVFPFRSTFSGSPATAGVYNEVTSGTFFGVQNTAFGTEARIEVDTFTVRMGAISNHPLIFETNNSERMRIDVVGNVGIGLTAPQVELHVQNNQNSDTDIEVENTTSGTLANARLIVSNNIGAAALTAYSSLFTTVGSLMADAVELRANSNMPNGLNIVAQALTAPIRFYAGGVNSERMRITETGPVGIGTTAPDASALLDLTSTTRGFLMPRMIEVDLNAIPSPATGLQVYDTLNNIPRIFDGIEWRALTDPTNVVKISSQQDWDNLSATTVITISASTTLLVTTAITTDKRIDIIGSASFSLLGNKLATVSIKYTGAGDFITADGVPFLRVNGFNNIDGDGTGTFLNISNSTIFVEIASIGAFNWADLGTITDCAQFRVPTAGFFFFGAGLKLNGVGRTFLKEIAGFNIVSVAGPWFSFKNTFQTPVVAATISENTITLKSDESLVSIDPGIGEDSRIRVNGDIVLGDGNLYASGGVTGSFTSVTDKFFTKPIALVEDNGLGLAHFHHGTPEVFAGQEVTISGFVINTAYNGTFIVTVNDDTAFEIGVPFGTSESGGTVVSNTVDIDSAGHGLAAGDTLVIDTDLSTDYDGGATLYGVFTNSFRINKPFTITATGSWNTAKINQLDSRVLSFENPGFIDSKYIAAAFVNNNTSAVGNIINTVFRDLVFGTSGAGLTTGSTIERWKLLLDHDGTFEYTGNEPFDGVISFDFTVGSVGGSEDFKFKWEKSTDGGVTFNDLSDPVEALVNVGNDSRSVTKTFPLTASKGDQIRPQITRLSGTSSITVQYATIYITD